MSRSRKKVSTPSLQTIHREVHRLPLGVIHNGIDYLIMFFFGMLIFAVRNGETENPYMNYNGK